MNVKKSAVVALMLVLPSVSGCAWLFDQAPNPPTADQLNEYVEQLAECEKHRKDCDDDLDRCQKGGVTLMPHVQ